MRNIDASINDTDDDIGASDGRVPGFGCVNVGIGCAAGLSGVVQAPLFGELRIVWHRPDSDDGIGLGEGKARDGLERREKPGRARTSWRTGNEKILFSQVPFDLEQ